MVLYPLSAFRGMSAAAEKVYQTILETGNNADAVKYMHTRERTYSVIDYHGYEKRVDEAAQVANKADGN